MAEILSSTFNYNIHIYTSNAIDFKALREPEGKTIKENDNNFNTVNNLSIQRCGTTYDDSFEQVFDKLKRIREVKSLNIPDESLISFMKNGPISLDMLDRLLTSSDLSYDLVHTTFFPYFNLITSLIIGKKLNRQVVCTPFFHYSNPRYDNKDLHDILKKFDHLIACTHAEKRYLFEKIGISGNKISVIPMGVDYEKFKPKKGQHANFKTKYFAPDQRKYHLVLFCGYKNYEKGALSILKAIPHIIKEVRKTYFVFIGPATLAFNRELSKLRQSHDPLVINFTPDNLTGYFDSKKIAAFKEADLYLMPSRSDAFGIAFLEAWAAGKPVIGANIGATPEVIRENVDGLLVEFDNPKAIAEKTIFLLKKKRLRKKLGSTGSVRVSKNYRWIHVARMTDNLYKTLIPTRS